MTDVPPEEMERALRYYKSQVEKFSVEILQKDAGLAAMRREVVRRRRGFALLLELDSLFGRLTEVDALLEAAAPRIAVALAMDQVFVMKPSGTAGLFEATLRAGEGSSERVVGGHYFSKKFSDDAKQFLFVNSSSELAPEVTALREYSQLPYFACVPVVVEDRAVAILLAGRMKEVSSVLLPIDMLDVEILQAVAGLLVAIIQNKKYGALKELDSLKTDFFANISHEFRTPITLTVGPIDGILNGRFGAVPEEMRGQLAIMRRNQERLLKLINEILDLSKLEAGAAAPEFRRLPDFNSYVSLRLEQFQGLAVTRGLELRAELDPMVSTLEVYLDFGMMDKVLFNLLSNALKFTNHGQVTVRTRAGQGCLEWEVEDSGIGIRADQLETVFERFKQASGSASREYAGTGIGLALVQGIMDLHGGSVAVRSVYGKGTCFEMKLPTGKAHLAAENLILTEDFQAGFTEALTAPARGASPLPTPADAELEMVLARWNQLALEGRETDVPLVLYTDDNPELREHVRGLLAQKYRVLLAANGHQGLSLARAHTPDLILSDVVMPEMNGEDFLRAARALPELAEIPFVLLTASANEASKLANLEQGADDYLAKPFSEAELQARVKNLVAFRRQHLRIKQDIRAARGIQRTLLPPESQRFENCLIQYVNLPSEELSGDFLDTRRAGDWLYFYVADVTSHGTAAAQVTYLIKAAFTELVGAAAPPVDQLFCELARRFSAYGLDRSVAMGLGRLHLTNGAFEHGVSGFPTAFRVIQGRAISLNVLSGATLTNRNVDYTAAEFPVDRTVLTPGEAVFFFTDGCFEFTPLFGGKKFNLRRFTQLLPSLMGGDWRKEAARLLAVAKGSEQFEDDWTILRLVWE